MKWNQWILIYQFHLISRKCYSFLTFIKRVMSGKVFSAFLPIRTYLRKTLFFLEDAAVWAENLLCWGARNIHRNTHHNVMWSYLNMGCDMWCDVTWCDVMCYVMWCDVIGDVMWCDVIGDVMWCDVNALMSNRRQVISKNHQKQSGACVTNT